MLSNSDAIRSKRGFLAFAVSCVVYIAWVTYFWGYSMDDAFISFRYAEHLADGHGLTFSIGDQAVEGYSNFLLILILSLTYKIGLPTYLTAKLIGAVAFPLAGYVWYRFFASDVDNFNWLVAPLFLIAPVTALWGVSALEIGLHALIISLTVTLALRRSSWLYAILPALVLNRPEGVAIAAVTVTICSLTGEGTLRQRLKFFAPAAAIVATVFAALTLSRLHEFGYPLPNTYYAKRFGEPLAGYAELGLMSLFFLPMSLAVIRGIVELFRKRFGSQRLALFLGLYIAQAAISASVDPVQNMHFRYLIPFLPVLLAIALEMILLLHLEKHRVVSILIVTISLFLPTRLILVTVNQSEKIQKAQNEMIDWINTLPESTTISMTDMGRIPYYTKVHYNDIWGLVDETAGQEGFSALREVFKAPDYFAFVGYINGPKITLRFWREQQITDVDEFDLNYHKFGIFYPPGESPTKLGYYYVVSERN